MKASVPLPEELVRALDKSPRAKAIFDEMPPSHKREYASHIAEAKKEETRARRAEKAIAMILEQGAAKR